MWLPIFAFIIIQKLLSLQFPKESFDLVTMKSLVILFLIYLFFVMLLPAPVENFLFQAPPSQNCCPRGFNGKPVAFRYEGDNTRFKNCPPPSDDGEVIPNDYQKLEQIWEPPLLIEPYVSNQEYNQKSAAYYKPLNASYEPKNLFNPRRHCQNRGELDGYRVNAPYRRC